MQRVLMVAFSVVPSPERHAVQLVNELKALAPRYAVDVLSVKSADLPYVDRFMKTRMLRVPCGTGSLAAQVEAFRRAVWRQLDGVDYDVVHFRCPWGGRPVCERKKELGWKAIFDVTRSPAAEPRGGDPALLASLRQDETFCLEHADRIIVPTRTAAEHLRSRGRGAIEVVPPGVDVDLFDWEDALEAQPPRILFAGRLGPARGIRLLLEAARELVAKRPIELCLAGPVDPGFEDPLNEAIDRLGLGKTARLLGPVEHDDLPRLIATATVCVAPHAPDERDRPLAAAPTKILEYMACRRAVVAPRRAIVGEILHDGDEGLLFAPGDVRDLAAALLRLLEDAPLRTRLAEAGYQAARQRHPAAATRRRLLEVYAQFIPPQPWSVGETALPAIEIPSAPDSTTARHSLRRDAGVDHAANAPETPPDDARPEGTR